MIFLSGSIIKPWSFSSARTRLEYLSFCPPVLLCLPFYDCYCSVASLPFHVANLMIIVGISLLELRLHTLYCPTEGLTGLLIEERFSFNLVLGSGIRPQLKWWKKIQDGNLNDLISCQISQEEVKGKYVNKLW